MTYKEIELMEEGEISRHYRSEQKIVVETPHGDINAYVEPGCDLEKQKNLPLWLTYHDIGTNHRTCFGSFFALDECQIFKKLFCVVHIDAPGHEEGAETLTRKLTLDDMAHQVGYVLSKLGYTDKVSRVYGFGVGAGCSVLLKYATFDVNQKYFAGMILVNGSGSPAGWREYAWYKMLNMTIWIQGFSSRVKMAFLHRMFTADAIDNNEDLVEEFSSSLEKMNPSNIMAFLDAYHARQELIDDIDAISCFDVIQFCGGDNSDSFWHVKELNKMFNLGKSTFLNIDECRMLVTEEGPHHMANPIKYWLAGKGYVLDALDMRANRHPDDK